MASIALISDIHFGIYSRTQEFAVPGETIQDENKGAVSLKDSLISVLLENHVQYLFIAGDLTSRGSPQEFHYCQNEIISIVEKAGIPKTNIILGLGNHDIDWKISKLYEEYNSLASTDFPFELVKKQYQVIAANASIHNMTEISQPIKSGPAPFSGIIENEHFVTFILNSGWYCTHDQPQILHGKLSQEQLIWFKDCISNYKDDNRWKIALLHHHPFNYPYPIPTLDISTLEEGSDFLDIAGKNGINLVLHGHRHHPKAKTIYETGWIAPITFICAGSVSVNSKYRDYGSIPNTFHIIELISHPKDLILKNFQYTSMDGWIPLVKNCGYTPLDPIMYLGRVVEQEQINKELIKLVPDKSVDKICLPRWEDLSPILRSLSFEELNNRINEFYSNIFDMIDKYPNLVVLLRR